MFKQSKQVSPSLYPQNPQNSFNKLFNVQISVTSKPKIDVVSRISKPLQNISNVPTRRQEDQTKKTQAKQSPLRQTFQKNTHRNSSCISNLDEKPIPKINEKEKSPLQRSIKTMELQSSEKPSTQQKQPIQLKSNEPDQQIANEQNDLKSQQNLNQQEVPISQKQQSKLQIQSNQPQSLNNQQQKQKLSRPKTATYQLQLKQTIQQDQQVKPTQQHQLSKITQQTKSQGTLNKKQEQPIKTRQQQQILKGDQRFQDKLYECTEGCGRSFNAQALEKHSKICKKVFQQKRKVFNSQQQRVIEVEDGEQGRGIPMKRALQKQRTTEGQKQGEVKNEKPNWKAQSEAFRAIIRQGKGQQLGEEVSLNGAVESVEDLEQEKFCSRKFSVETFRKHRVFYERKAKECGKSGMQKKKK